MKFSTHITAAMRALIIFFVVLLVGISCTDDQFLAPDPKSFFSRDNTLIDRSGFEGVLLSARRGLALEYYGHSRRFLVELKFTDIALDALGADAGAKNMPVQITPTGTTSPAISIFTYWNHAYDNINLANIVISNIDNENVAWSSDEERNTVLAEGYFHRAYWYYRLVHQFGDVPLVVEEITTPRLDFNTFKREAVLQKIRDDMEFAVQWLPVDAAPGKENRGAGYHLLTKIYLALGEFQNAVDAASQVIDGGQYRLMRERFGQGRYANDPRFNVLWDLHEKENISSDANSEWLLAAQDQFGIDGAPGPTERMRYATPLWWHPLVKDPNGERGTTDGPEGNPLSDSLGRGIAFNRTTPYYNYEIWKDPDDLRHSDVNWFSKDDFYYNNPESEFYGEPFVEEFLGPDTTLTWFPFPYNKLYVPDEASVIDGGHSDWYIFRLAGTYLLRAEAYYWMGQMGQAAADINAVRERAEAQPVNPGEVTIGYIFDERARELYYEEPRKTELTRVAYIMAREGRNGYSLDNMHQNNWYFDRVMDTNVYFRENLTYRDTYVMEPYHVYWPIPQNEIDNNINGTINQNRGYQGAENNIEPLDLEDL